ncbi:MAG: class I SAM-dependent methyltransferase [Candidatus Bathyarchaeia archaeon]
MRTRADWLSVIEALEGIIPYYDRVNESISFGWAEWVRRCAVQQSGMKQGMSVLDVGVGPGNIPRLVLSHHRPGVVVGLDCSKRMLKTAQRALRPSGEVVVQFVRGVSERLPFRDGSFSLRDALDVDTTIGELRRVCRVGGLLTVVDIGKPDNGVFRALMALYMSAVMPAIARLQIIGKVSGNPWRLLIPTYEGLPTNNSLRNKIEKIFGKALLKEFLHGAMVMVQAEKRGKPLSVKS